MNNLKKLTISFLLLVGLFCKLQAQTSSPDFVLGEVIVKFKYNTLNMTDLESDAVVFDAAGTLISDNSLRMELNNLRVLSYERVVRKLRPHHNTSISRSGTEVEIPDLYNLMLIKVPEDTDILNLCENLNQLPQIDYAEPNHILELTSMPNDPFFNEQRGCEQNASNLATNMEQK